MPKLFNIHIDWLVGDDDHNAIESFLMVADSKEDAQEEGRGRARKWNIDRAFTQCAIGPVHEYYDLYRKVEDGLTLTDKDIEDLMEAAFYYSDAAHKFNAAVEVDVIREGDRFFKVETREISKEEALGYTTPMEGV